MKKRGTLQGLCSRIQQMRAVLRKAAWIGACAGLFALANLEQAGGAVPGQATNPAQKAMAPGATRAQKKTVHKRPAAKPSPATAAAAPAPAAPDWPANDHPQAAEVVWDSHGLRVDASNSSLEQILKDVSTATGAKLEGFSADQRVFGSYGPGTAREVLSELLDGSGYNVVLVGDQGEGTPREILLSSKPSGPAPAGRPGQSSFQAADEESEAAPEPPAPPFRNGMVPFGAPGEMRDERPGMQQLQQLQQQQQNGQPITPPATPGNPQF